MAEEYRIETINDLCQIPADKLEACLRDIEYAVNLHQLAFGQKNVPMGVITWIADGKHDIDMTDNQGNSILSLKVTHEDRDE